MEPDTIRLTGLSVASHIGVPTEERALPQHLRINLTIKPKNPLTGLQDDVQQTIDYASVAETVRKLAMAKPRKLIETLAEDIIDTLLHAYPIMKIQVEVVKFILPDTTSVSVTLGKYNPDFLGIPF